MKIAGLSLRSLSGLVQIVKSLPKKNLSDRFFLIDFFILSAISFEFCSETIIFEFNKDEVFSKIILSNVFRFFGNQSK